MKRVVSLCVMVLLVASMSAQEKRKMHARENFENATPEQLAELKTKKMALDLDLNEKQQKEIYALNLEESKKQKEMFEARQKMKESGERPDKTDRMAMMNEHLDKQLEVQNKMKGILNEAQYAKWKEHQEKRSDLRKPHRKGK